MLTVVGPEHHHKKIQQPGASMAFKGLPLVLITPEPSLTHNIETNFLSSVKGHLNAQELKCSEQE